MATAPSEQALYYAQNLFNLLATAFPGYVADFGARMARLFAASDALFQDQTNALLVARMREAISHLTALGPKMRPILVHLIAVDRENMEDLYVSRGIVVFVSNEETGIAIFEQDQGYILCAEPIVQEKCTAILEAEFTLVQKVKHALREWGQHCVIISHRPYYDGCPEFDGVANLENGAVPYVMVS
ncbi:hypothetical protein QBC41DRAFT_304322 [Cercophora samala]|uniref:Uncharacterized protein n=1 Tax=Cercophora samala TaxID=330535 RepID=A0AA39ZAS7_9PEZI|nr:hypothetical protein QBC41DRAFT_304322 [Cercophora samala]